MNVIKIEMVHDLVCSWCPIGYNHLKTALKRLEGKVKADVRFLPFQLNPDIPREGVSIADYFQGRMGWNSEQLKQYQTSLVETGKAAGVLYDFTQRTHYYNTYKGHCLIHWAEKLGQHRVLNELMIVAYFEQGKDLSDETVLLDLVEKLGLDRNDAQEAFSDPNLLKEVNKKQQRVTALNISSIPAFLINDEHCISGSNSPDFFEDVLLKINTDATQQIADVLR